MVDPNFTLDLSQLLNPGTDFFPLSKCERANLAIGECGKRLIMRSLLHTVAWIGWFASVISLQGFSANNQINRRDPANNLKSIVLSCAGDMNFGRPLNVDLVFVHDAKVIDMILNETATGWFKNKKLYLAASPKSYEVMEWQVVPGHTLRVKGNMFPVNHRRALKVILFAEYLDQKGQHPTDLTEWVNPEVALLGEGYEVLEQRNN